MTREGISRRSLLKAGGVLVVGVALAGERLGTGAAQTIPNADRFLGKPLAVDRVDAFLAIHADGSVTLFTEGAAEAETVNGSIDAALGRTDWKQAASFQTVNGSITLALPREASAEVEARTVNGRIATDFALAGARITRRELTGTIGAGGRKLAVETVNGGIRLRQAN